MCGRYVVEGTEDLSEFSERFQLRQIPLSLFTATYNAAPSQELPVVLAGDEGERDLRLLRWGLLPRWRKPGQASSVAPINARAETLLEKPMFRPLVGRRRCLVPASGFYEWRRTGGPKQPYYIHPRDRALVGFAGLYDESPDGVGSFTIITTSPNELVAPLHDRMPAILRPEDEADWLSPDLTDPHAAQALLRPYPAAAMAADPVSPAVNNTRNNGPELIAPLERMA
jgi:putative SOS response-associated peptidase YedK